jgi:hypothetical protein
MPAVAGGGFTTRWSCADGSRVASLRYKDSRTVPAAAAAATTIKTTFAEMA